MKKIITILAAVTIVSCAKQQRSINPVNNYHVVINAKDTIQASVLGGKLTIGNTTLNIRKGYGDSTVVDTFITDDVSLGLHYALYISKIQKNCSFKIDTTGNIKLSITGGAYTYTASGFSIVQ